MSGRDCEELHAAAPELALGVLDGEERARALEHVGACAACRAHLAELAVVAEAVLTAAPVHEPPAGFESRVLEALPGRRRRPLRRRRRAARPIRRLLPALAVALVLGAGVATWTTLSATQHERDLGTYYESVLARAGGKYLAATELRDAAGRRHGVLFAYQGDVPWVTAVLDAAGGRGPLRVRIATRDGATRELGRWDPAATGAAWGHELPVAVRELASVRLDGDDGRALVAELHRR